MATNHLPSFAALIRRYGSEALPVAHHDERERLIDYLEEQGSPVTSVEDVYHAVLTLEHEEELTAFRCREGVAVSHASDGWWLLLKSGEPIRASRARPAGVGGC